MKKVFIYLLGLLLLAGLTPGAIPAADKVIKMSTTTSTENSGLLDVLLPAFKKDTGIKVKVVAKGTGAAIMDGQDGNVDVIFVHSRPREEAFVAKGYGTKRYAVMHNDFVILGPPGDPAGVKGLKDAAASFRKIAAAKVLFVSRGDSSGTHFKEIAVWKATGLPLKKTVRKLVREGRERQISFLQPDEDWYMSIGQGMGKALTFADEKQAYLLSDRGTYIKYKFGKKPPVTLEVLSEGDKRLANPYGVIPINPEKHRHVRYELARRFAEWLASPRGQGLIARYKLHGRQLFYPDAIPGAK